MIVFLWQGHCQGLRFRLDRNTAAKGRVGEDRSFPLLAGVTIGYPFARLTLLAGAKLGGQLRIDSPTGERLVERDYDPTFTFGGTFQLLF